MIFLNLYYHILCKKLHNKATRTVTSDLMNRGYSKEESTNITNNLSEIEKENMANDILGEVKINEDITEQEVKQEQENIQLKLFGGVEENVNIENVKATQNNNTELYDIQNVPDPKTTKELDTVIEKVSEEQPEQEKTAFQQFKDKFNEYAERVYTELYDRFAPIQNAVKKANKQGADLGIDITDNNWTENPYNLARMYAGLGNRIIQHFEHCY